MSAAYRLSPAILEHSFAHFRDCGCGRRECQVLWVGPWNVPDTITKAVHPKHRASGGGFQLDDQWLNEFWLELGNTNMGIRAQVHTHPREAFHSQIDDEYPIIHKAGFLSLVVPNFGLGAVGFKNAYLTEIQTDGRWKEVTISSRLVLT